MTADHRQPQPRPSHHPQWHPVAAENQGPWRDLPERNAPDNPSTSAFAAGARPASETGGPRDVHPETGADGVLDWTLYHLDGTMISTHPYAAGVNMDR